MDALQDDSQDPTNKVAPVAWEDVAAVTPVPTQPRKLVTTVPRKSPQTKVYTPSLLRAASVVDAQVAKARQRAEATAAAMRAMATIPSPTTPDGSMRQYAKVESMEIPADAGSVPSIVAAPIVAEGSSVMPVAAESTDKVRVLKPRKDRKRPAKITGPTAGPTPALGTPQAPAAVAIYTTSSTFGAGMLKNKKGKSAPKMATLPGLPPPLAVAPSGSTAFGSSMLKANKPSRAKLIVPAIVAVAALVALYFSFR